METTDIMDINLFRESCDIQMSVLHILDWQKLLESVCV